MVTRADFAKRVELADAVIAYAVERVYTDRPHAMTPVGLYYIARAWCAMRGYEIWFNELLRSEWERLFSMRMAQEV